MFADPSSHHHVGVGSSRLRCLPLHFSRGRVSLAVVAALLSFACLIRGIVAASGGNSTPDAASFFANTNHEAFVSWLNNHNNEEGSSLYSHYVFLPSPSSAENGVALFWKIELERLYVAVAARATGWLGFGISENGGMFGADVVLYTATDNALVDAHIGDNRYPVTDTCQDWTLLNSQTSGGFIIWEGVRDLETSDLQDHSIVNDAGADVPPHRIIAAWGDNTQVTNHGPNSRVRSAVRFYGPTGSANGAVELERFRAAMDSESEGYIDLRAVDHPVSTMETEYAMFCFSLSDLLTSAEQPLHAIGIEPVIDDDTEPYVHHFTVYSSNTDWNLTSEECNDVFSTDMFYVWAPGEGPLDFPSDVGASIGGQNGSIFFWLEIHYNNPTGVAGLSDSSGIRVYYTSTLRGQEMGVLQVGDPFLGLFGQPVGEGITKHEFICPSSCSNLALSRDAIVFREYLHMHQNGVRIINAQIRSGVVVREGWSDHWDFDQQGLFAVQQDSFTIKPGDEFQTTCYFNAGASDTFGLGSQDEMCIAFLFYYPKQSSQFVCSYGEEEFPECSTSYQFTQLNGVADVGRRFGQVPDTCEVQAQEDGAPDNSSASVPNKSGWYLFALSTSFIVIAAGYVFF